MSVTGAAATGADGAETDDDMGDLDGPGRAEDNSKAEDNTKAEDNFEAP